MYPIVLIQHTGLALAVLSILLGFFGGWRLGLWFHQRDVLRSHRAWDEFRMVAEARAQVRRAALPGVA